MLPANTKLIRWSADIAVVLTAKRPRPSSDTLPRRTILRNGRLNSQSPSRARNRDPRRDRLPRHPLRRSLSLADCGTPEGTDNNHCRWGENVRKRPQRSNTDPLPPPSRRTSSTTLPATSNSQPPRRAPNGDAPPRRPPLRRALSFDDLGITVLIDRFISANRKQLKELAKDCTETQEECVQIEQSLHAMKDFIHMLQNKSDSKHVLQQQMKHFQKEEEAHPRKLQQQQQQQPQLPQLLVVDDDANMDDNSCHEEDDHNNLTDDDHLADDDNDDDGSEISCWADLEETLAKVSAVNQRIQTDPTCSSNANTSSRCCSLPKKKNTKMQNPSEQQWKQRLHSSPTTTTDTKKILSQSPSSVVIVEEGPVVRDKCPALPFRGRDSYVLE